MLSLYSIGAQITAKRKALRLNQSELAKAAGVSRATAVTSPWIGPR